MGAAVLTPPHANARAAIMAMHRETLASYKAIPSLGNVWDYSSARPTLMGAPIVGICRYLDYLPNPKVIGSAELTYIEKCGKVVLFNWENGAQDMLGGAITGQEHGQEANRQLDTLGIPRTIPIIYSADWDAQPSQYPVIASYLDNALKFGRPVGIYGKNAMVHWMLQNGHATFGWVTLAWLYGYPVSPLAHLFQNGVNSPNGTDSNIILKPYWGFYPYTEGVFTVLSDQQQADMYNGVINSGIVINRIIATLEESVDNTSSDNLSGSGIPWAINQLLIKTANLEAQVAALTTSQTPSVASSITTEDVANAVIAALKSNPLHP